LTRYRVANVMLAPSWKHKHMWHGFMVPFILSSRCGSLLWRTWRSPSKYPT